MTDGGVNRAQLNLDAVPSRRDDQITDTVTDAPPPVPAAFREDSR